ncbi:ubiquinol-cytochrome-c reductase complex assembly factor 1 isoform X2 [Mauremys reevesii]|uniref:ubiquinol-cytochrome-c reductase complex assembly factor 1 isoform X2 n=1 Tax=Mauremys reevesii TaxID=260615 RepID=UPI00193FF6A1|nr:ubiquinol-cytochrome-c reductase complex assembly factor 1 isoform X2 [Mauremys reevesii]
MSGNFPAAFNRRWLRSLGPALCPVVGSDVCGPGGAGPAPGFLPPQAAKKTKTTPAIAICSSPATASVFGSSSATGPSLGEGPRDLLLYCRGRPGPSPLAAPSNCLLGWCLEPALKCQTGMPQWITVCSGLIQSTLPQAQWDRMLYGTLQRHETGRPQLNKVCGGLIQTSGARTQQRRMLHSTDQFLAAKDSLQPSEEKVGAFTKIIEAMGFTGPLKYNKWKIKIAALRMYTCCVERTDYEEFFHRCHMPDTLNSWFLIAQLHVWMCLVRMKQEGRAGKYMCRYIVHSMWEDVEQRGKVMGIDSFTLKQSMRSMTENFYAAIFGYDENQLIRPFLLDCCVKQLHMPQGEADVWCILQCCCSCVGLNMWNIDRYEKGTATPRVWGCKRGFCLMTAYWQQHFGETFSTSTVRTPGSWNC